MPHGARQISASGYYHVVPKGIADQLIFRDDDDRTLYLTLLERAKNDFGIVLHAYCLMSNHAHLIIQDAYRNLSDFIKFIHERYATAYANKIERTGGVFQRRCWSEPIETDSHLLCAARYVHANPAAAGICPASQYDWSSAKDYLGRCGFTDTDTILALAGGVEGFIAWSQSKNATATPFPGSRLQKHLSDEEALRIARDVIGDKLDGLDALSDQAQAPYLRRLVERGFGRSQISRITGLGRKHVERLLARR